MKSKSVWIWCALLPIFALAPIVTAQDDTPASPKDIYNATITTAGSYDSKTGNQMRAIDDLVVAGSVGAYPLKWTRYYNTNVQNGQWTFSYKDMRHGQLPDGRVLPTSPYDGQGVPDYQGTWTSPNGVAYGANFLSDGGWVKFSKQYWTVTINGTSVVQHISEPIEMTDPYGQVTTMTYVARGTHENTGNPGEPIYVLDRVTEPGGRYFQITWQDSPADRPAGSDPAAVISKVEAFDGQGNSLGWVQYHWVQAEARYNAVIDRVDYADGTSAYYTYATLTAHFGGGNQLHYPDLFTADDVRYNGAMRQIAYGRTDTGGNFVMVKAAESNFNTHEELSKINFSSNDKRQLPDGTWQMSYVTLGETRGDGATRTFTYAYPCTWTHHPSETEECEDIIYGKLITYTDFLGHTTNISYDMNRANSIGYINSVTDPNNHTTIYTRATAQHNTWNITRIDYPDGSFLEQTYTDDAKPYYLASRTAQRGPGDLPHTTTYTRDDNHRIRHKDYPDGGWEEFDYNGLGQVTQHRRCKDGTTVETESFVYDARGLKTSYTDPAGGVTTYSYYTSGPWADRLQTVTYPANASGLQTTESYEYDRAYANGENTGAPSGSPIAGRGLVTRITHADGTYKSFGYNKYGDKLWEEDELRHRTSYTYDEYGRVLTTKSQLNHTTTNSYVPTGLSSSTITASKLPFATTLPSGKTTKFEYDPNWRKTRVRVAADTPEEAATRYVYDEGQGNIGHLTTMIDPRNNPTTYGYDLRDRQTSVTDALAHTDRVVYDLRGLKITETKANGELIEYDGYDEMNRLTHKKVHRDAMHVDEVSMTYDCAGNLQNQIDENGNTYAYSYDEMNRPTVMTYPNQKTEIHEYDAAGNVKNYTNRSGAVQTFGYDNRNRQTGFSWSNEPQGQPHTSSQTTSYDAASRKTGIDNADATITLGYDDENHLTSQTETVIASGVGDNIARTVTYAYDADGNRLSIQYPSGSAFNYTYTQRNQTKTINPGLSGGTPIVTYAFDPSGNITGRSLDNGTATAFTVDQVNRDTSVEHKKGANMVKQFDYAYNEVNDMTAVVRDENPNDSDGFKYDLTQQIVEFQQTGHFDSSTGMVTNPAKDNMMAFDGCGNRTQLNGQPQLFNSMNQPTDVGHDNNGNVQSYNGFTYTYDAQNRLRQVAAAGFTEDFYYDGLNRQVARVTNGSVAPTPTPVPSVIPQLSPLPTVPPTPTVSPTPSVSPSVPSLSPTPTVPSISPTPTITVPPIGITPTPTPSSTPTPTPTPEQCAPVTFSVVSDTEVKMETTTPGATIFYTVKTGSYDGVPTHSGGTPTGTTQVYNGQLDWSCDVPYFEAIAYKAGMTDSGVTTAHYDFWIGGCGGGDGMSGMSSSSVTVTVFSVWDGDWAILEEYDASGNLVQGYVQGHHGLVKTLVDNIYYYQDELGSTSHVADAGGALLEYYKYDLYGKPQFFDANGVQLIATAYGVRDLGNGGARWIPEIGLYDDRNRFMSPDLGRFLQPDPIGFKGDASNLYRYCGNDWANKTDPFGLEVGFGESLIPVWGEGHMAYDSYRAGNYWMAGFHAAMAITDVSGAKSLVSAAAKTGVKMAAERTAVKAGESAVRHTAAEKALQGMAQQDAKTGITRADAHAYEALNNEAKAQGQSRLKVEIHEGHEKRPGPISKGPHLKVGRERHIEIREQPQKKSGPKAGSSNESPAAAPQSPPAPPQASNVEPEGPNPSGGAEIMFGAQRETIHSGSAP